MTTTEDDDQDQRTAGETGNGLGPPVERLSYGQALDELEDLLDELEGADVDVDLLAERVARGVQLVRFCRSRLEVVTDEVDAIVTELISVEGGVPQTPSGDDSEDDQ